MRAKPESRASNLIVLVESELKYIKYWAQTLKNARKMIVLPLAIYSGIDSKQSGQSNYSICNSILV